MSERVVVLCTFTAEPLVAGLRRAFEGQGVRWDVEAGPYGQVVEPLKRPCADDVVAVVLVVRIADLLRRMWVDTHGGETAHYDTEPDPQATRRAEEWVHDLVAGVATWRATASAPLLLSVLDDARTPGPRSLCERLATAARDGAAESGVLVVEAGELEGEPFLDTLAHVPYQPAGLAELAARLARRCWLQVRPSVKVLVFDGDGTLWGGSAAEDGPAGVDRGGPYARIGLLALQQRASGRLLCLASHNVELDVLDVLAAPPSGGGLRAEHLSARRVGWQPKDRMLVELAGELGLGLDTFVFLDDNDVQRALVRSALPQVAVPDFTSGGGLVTLLGTSWLFERSHTTPEDRTRAGSYEDERRRRAARAAAPSHLDYVASLQVEVTARPLDASAWPRARQLLARTNQFAHVVPGFRLPAGSDRADPDRRTWIVQVKDRIGDYGRVGLVADRVVGDTLWIEALLLSCRVLGRGVEEEMVEVILRDARAAKIATVRMDLVRTPRNAPLQNFVTRLGGQLTGSGSGLVSLHLPVRL
ncbi:HAD-IIIC family phosphatase [Pseudonocardia broussonetiae]|uniref:HAD-IIIC family phosphatase n=1 Tax=Pseudonocardia broussonetiae TaxID=2736640 RepID=A0A6M6JFM5_9PSEU|nr:HAD-IIIC family phosphatase [Pseudonocardia broussonetiae]QJY45727.1 HAD-IIIC family phosphatase [Pseudonocardia broussonetiae]